MFLSNVVDLNDKVYVLKSAGVCTFVTVRLVERLKMAPEQSGTEVEALREVRKVPGAKSKLWYIPNKDCG